MTTTFDTFLLAGQRPGGRRTRAVTHAFAVALHAAAVAAAVVYGPRRVEEAVAAPAVPIFIRAPLPAAGAPAAAAPARPKTRTPRPKVTRRALALVQQPKEVPPEAPQATDSAAPDDARIDDGGRGGGGGKGPGGGGGDHFIAPNVAIGQLAIDPHVDPHRVRLPPALARAGLQVWALVRVCVDRDGRVDDVHLLKSADPVVDPLIVAALRTWRYRPYQVNGRPVPFCTNIRYVMATR
jgi:protein TonB